MKKIISAAIAGIVVLSSAFAKPDKGKEDSMYRLNPLPYQYSALEPVLDAQTLMYHHDKHQAAYVNNLNAALQKEPNFNHKPALVDLISDLDSVPESIREAVRNNGGGVFNHEFYWNGLTPNKPEIPKVLSEALCQSFGSVENFKSQMAAAAVGVFGSGWAWLCLDPSTGKLKIVKTRNQDTPMNCSCQCAKGLIPIFCIDVWEHAYYLQYKNLRAKYLESIWDIVDWEKICRRYCAALKDKSILM